eukprot:UN22153
MNSHRIPEFCHTQLISDVFLLTQYRKSSKFKSRTSRRFSSIDFLFL